MRKPVAWSRARFLVLCVVAATIYGVVGYMVLEGWGFLDALYMTTMTLSTVGFREVRPLDAGGQLFTMSLIVIGVVIVLVTISVIAAWFADEQLGQARRRRRMEKRADRKSNHFIVCAYGRVGRAVARDFAEAGVDYLVIDIDEELEPRMREDGVAYLIGDPANEPTLAAAGVHRARGLICAVDSDATNVYITLVARSMNPDLLIVARAAEPNSAERLMKAGADRVVSPYVSSGRHMALMATNPAMVDVLEFAGKTPHPLWVEEIQVNEGSSAVGQTVAEVVGAGSALAVRHEDGIVDRHPDGATVLRAGDLLLRLADTVGD